MVSMDTFPEHVSINRLLLEERIAVNSWSLKVKRNDYLKRCLAQSTQRKTRLLVFIGKHWAPVLGHLGKHHPQEIVCESDHGTWTLQGKVAPVGKWLGSSWGNHAITTKLEPTWWVGRGRGWWDSTPVWAVEEVWIGLGVPMCLQGVDSS